MTLPIFSEELLGFPFNSHYICRDTGGDSIDSAISSQFGAPEVTEDTEYGSEIWGWSQQDYENAKADIAAEESERAGKPVQPSLMLFYEKAMKAAGVPTTPEGAAMAVALQASRGEVFLPDQPKDVQDAVMGLASTSPQMMVAIGNATAKQAFEKSKSPITQRTEVTVKSVPRMQSLFSFITNYYAPEFVAGLPKENYLDIPDYIREVFDKAGKEKRNPSLEELWSIYNHPKFRAVGWMNWSPWHAAIYNMLGLGGVQHGLQHAAKGSAEYTLAMANPNNAMWMSIFEDMGYNMEVMGYSPQRGMWKFNAIPNKIALTVRTDEYGFPLSGVKTSGHPYSGVPAGNFDATGYWGIDDTGDLVSIEYGTGDIHAPPHAGVNAVWFGTPATYWNAINERTTGADVLSGWTGSDLGIQRISNKSITGEPLTNIEYFNKYNEDVSARHKSYQVIEQYARGNLKVAELYAQGLLDPDSYRAIREMIIEKGRMGGISEAERRILAGATIEELKAEVAAAEEKYHDPSFWSRATRAWTNTYDTATRILENPQPEAVTRAVLDYAASILVPRMDENGRLSGTDIVAASAQLSALVGNIAGRMPLHALGSLWGHTAGPVFDTGIGFLTSYQWVDDASMRYQAAYSNIGAGRYPVQSGVVSLSSLAMSTHIVNPFDMLIRLTAIPHLFNNPREAVKVLLGGSGQFLPNPLDAFRGIVKNPDDTKFLLANTAKEYTQNTPWWEQITNDLILTAPIPYVGFTSLGKGVVLSAKATDTIADIARTTEKINKLTERIASFQAEIKRMSAADFIASDFVSKATSKSGKRAAEARKIAEELINEKRAKAFLKLDRARLTKMQNELKQLNSARGALRGALTRELGGKEAAARAMEKAFRELEKKQLKASFELGYWSSKLEKAAPDVKKATEIAAKIATLNAQSTTYLRQMMVLADRLGMPKGKQAALKIMTRMTESGLAVPQKITEITKSVFTKGGHLSRLPSRSVGARLRSVLFGAKGVLGKSQLGQMLYAYALQKDIAKTLAGIEVAELMGKGAWPLSVKILDDGSVIYDNVARFGTGGRRATLHPYDVYGDASHYKFIAHENTPPEWVDKKVSEHPAIQHAVELNNKRLAMLKEAGIDVNLIDMPDNKNYISRVGTSGKTFIARGNKAFHEKVWQQSRHIQDFVKAIEEGFIEYETDLPLVIYKTLESSYMAIIEKDLTDLLKAGNFAQEVAAKASRQDRILHDTQNRAMKAVVNAIGSNKGDIKLGKTTMTTIEGLSEELATAIKSGKSRDEIKQIADKVLANLDAKGKLLAQAEKLETFDGFIGLEGFGFSAEVAKELKAAFREYPTKWEKALNWISAPWQIAKFIITGFDVGTPFTLGLPLLFQNPKAWTAAVKLQYQGLVSDKFWHGYIAKNKAIAREAVVRGGMLFRTSDFMEGADILARWKITRAISRPFERSFDNFIDGGKLELFKALYRPSMTDAEAKALGTFCEQIVGSMSAKKYALGNVSSKIETMLLFAPRYYRASLALVGDIAGGKVTGLRAFRAVGRLMAGIHLQYFAFCKLIGQEPHLDPNDSRYLSFRLGDTWVGVGGFHRSLGMSLWRIATAAANGDPERAVYVAERFFQAHLSGYMRAPLDATLGKTYLGDSVMNLGDFMKHEIFLSNMPFAASEVVKEITINPNRAYNAEIWARFIFESLGLRTSPASAQEKLRGRMDELARQGSASPEEGKVGVDYNTLKIINPKQARAIQDLPEIRELQEAAHAERFAKGPNRFEMTRQYMDFITKEKGIKADADAAKWAASYKLSTREYDEKQAREVWQAAAEKQANAIMALKKEYPKVYEELHAPRRPKNIGDEVSINTLAYYDYVDIVYGDKRLDDDRLTWQQRSDIQYELEKQIIDKYGQEAFDYVQEALLAGRGLPAAYSAYKLDVGAIGRSGMWDITNKHGYNSPELAQFFIAHPDINAKAYVWGYTNSIQTEDARRIAHNLLAASGIPKGVPLPISTVKHDNQIAELDRRIQHMRSLKAGSVGKSYDMEVAQYEKARGNLLGALQANRNIINNINIPVEQQELALKELDRLTIIMEELKNEVDMLAATKGNNYSYQLLQLQMQRDILINRSSRARAESNVKR